MNKSQIKERMLALTEADMAQAEQKYLVFLTSARLARTATIQSDEQVRAKTAADLAEVFDDRTQGCAEKLVAFNTIEFGPKGQVSAGAIVKAADRYSGIGVSTAARECGRNSFVGTSTAARTFNGRELIVGEAH